MLVVSAALLALLLIPRLSDLDALVTPDEPLWIARSANFYHAITQGDLRDTYQYVHPGVPLMWLGALGYYLHIPDMPELMGNSLPVRNRAVQDVLEQNGYAILDVLVELRQVVIVASALVVLGIFFCLTKIVDFWAAAAAIAFLALDPMHIGFTRLLHLDGLSANLVVLAIVAFSWYLQTWSTRALAVAGLVTGIACLTRTANAVVGPFFAVLAVCDVALASKVDRANVRPLIRRYVVALLVSGALAFVVFVALWPAMWVAPIDTLRALWSGSRDLSGSGADRDLYFRGSVSGDPGWQYYPVVLAHRLGGFTAIGIVLAMLAAVRPRDIGERFNRRLALHLSAFAAMYMVILSLSPKKLDRYVLPSVVALDLVAALAWVAGAIWLGRKLIHTSSVGARWVSVLLVVVVLLGQTDYALRMRPFYIDAASPLLGGVSGAQDDFSFNWGEGGKEIAEALRKIPGIENASVAAGPWQATIDYYLPFRLQGPEYGSNLRTASVWMNTDYVVLSYPEVQRELYSTKLLAWFDQQEPVATVTNDGGVYARIFDIRDVFPPDSFYSGVPKANWENTMTVLAANYPDSKSAGSEFVDVSLFVQTSEPPREIQVTADLISNDGVVAGSVTTNVFIAPGDDGIAKITFKIPMSADVEPMRYRIRYLFSDVETKVPLTGINIINGDPITNLVSIGTVLIKPTRPEGSPPKTN
ncbi:hypothetical protein BH09CHL1_BH09CHL1_35910 [soil metagenome]